MTAMMMRRYMPHALMVLAQLFFTLLYFIAEAAFNRGLNSFVYVTYRHLLAACILCPFAYFKEKTLRPKMTPMLFLEIFVLSLVGGSLTLNMYFSSLKYTSPTFVTSMLNTVASITFVVAVVLRLEIVDVRTLRGLAKIAGTAVSLAGVTTISLYRGAAVKRPWRAPAVHVHGIGGAGHVEPHESWVKGSLLALASCICWSICFILQASSIKRYPAKLSLTAWTSLVGGLQSAAFAAFVQRDARDWLVGFGLNFWAIVYAGERPRVRRHVQPPPHRHGGTPRLLRLRRKPIRWERDWRAACDSGALHAAVGQGQGPRTARVVVIGGGQRAGAPPWP
ncbi:WAT1-related protein At4g08290-like isoform X6 [Zea mays]|uniref:WAT1-related protein n=1 Tax=Zea mays TaxID=4577 RepID=A0A804LLX7_MAIZE|nr:uncharacterized protein LOC100304260 isoform X6 [Zea mays]XP_035814814.1 uncharacterized protein LOC100304260 isoform X6 [Zea mays]|eukprot:XP_008681296.1 uncharacterized protein LOC100304260 isoform X5 [Zea mays]